MPRKFLLLSDIIGTFTMFQNQNVVTKTNSEYLAIVSGSHPWTRIFGGRLRAIIYFVIHGVLGIRSWRNPALYFKEII